MAVKRTTFPSAHTWPGCAYTKTFGSGSQAVGPSVTKAAQLLRFREKTVIKSLKVSVESVIGSMGAELSCSLHPGVAWSSGGTYATRIHPDTATTLAGPVTATPVGATFATLTFTTAYEVDPVVNPFVFLVFENTNATPATNYYRLESVGMALLNLQPDATASVPILLTYSGTAWSITSNALNYAVLDEGGRPVSVGAGGGWTAGSVDLYGSTIAMYAIYYLPPVPGLSFTIRGINVVADMNGEPVLTCDVMAGLPEAGKVLASATRTFGGNMADEELVFMFERPPIVRGGFLTFRWMCPDGTGASDSYNLDIMPVTLGTASVTDAKRATFGHKAVRRIPNSSYVTPCACWRDSGGTYTYDEDEVVLAVPVVTPHRDIGASGASLRTRALARRYTV